MSVALLSWWLNWSWVLWGWSRAELLSVTGWSSSILLACLVSFIYILAYTVCKRCQSCGALLQADAGHGQKPSLENPTSGCCNSKQSSHQSAGSWRQGARPGRKQFPNEMIHLKKNKIIGNAPLWSFCSCSELKPGGVACMLTGEVQGSLTSFCYMGNSSYRGVTCPNQGAAR